MTPAKGRRLVFGLEVVGQFVVIFELGLRLEVVGQLVVVFVEVAEGGEGLVGGGGGAEHTLFIVVAIAITDIFHRYRGPGVRGRGVLLERGSRGQIGDRGERRVFELLHAKHSRENTTENTKTCSTSVHEPRVEMVSSAATVHTYMRVNGKIL